VTHTLDLGAHTLFIGEVKNVLASASLTGESGKLSWEKADLLLYDSVSRTYRTAGDCVAKAFSIGLSYRGE
jgi:flavin reductase (DIM6/NTAB) family NADH-FMN oxidoreductase RutF